MPDFLPAVGFARINDAARRHAFSIATAEEHFDRHATRAPRRARSGSLRSWPARNRS
ncbi:hypothetical protein [Streptomyces sp. NPDC029041]|uniref:hypothetical protein n=1 Tax=Streptomyces sp. NPDC029041 TaxID=3155727 RepID=UPI0033DD9124